MIKMIKSNSKRYMGLDYGDRRIGIAFSDLTGTIASAFEVYHRKTEEEDLAYLSQLAKNQEATKIIIGLPLNADGTEGERTKVTFAFGEKLAKLANLEVDYSDERFSSLEAEELLKEARLPWQERKKLLDKVAAQIILQDYLNTKK